MAVRLYALRYGPIVCRPPEPRCRAAVCDVATAALPADLAPPGSADFASLLFALSAAGIAVYLAQGRTGARYLIVLK